MRAGRPATAIGLAIVAAFAAHAVLLGWAALALLERFLPRHARIVWTVPAVAVLAVSFAPLPQATKVNPA